VLFRSPDKPEYNYVREVDYCSGTASLMKKEVFDAAGGLDTLYKPIYYDDTDLCFKLRRQGYRILYQPRSVIVHFEGVSCGKDVRTGIKSYQAINKNKFSSRWKDELGKDHYPPGICNLMLARNRLGGKNILVIDRGVPSYGLDSGSLRMYNILLLLRELGHRVTFIGDDLMKPEPYTSRLQQAGIEVAYAPYIDSIDVYLSRHGWTFDAVVLSRAHIAIEHVTSVKKYCLYAKVIFDTAGLQFLRESRRAAIENDDGVLHRAEKLRKLELGVAALSDVTLVLSPDEKAIIAENIPSMRVEIVSNIHEAERDGISGILSDLLGDSHEIP